MPAHLLGTLFRRILNAAHTLCLLLDAISDTFTSRSTSTPSAFDVITVNTLYALVTYLLTYSQRDDATDQVAAEAGCELLLQCEPHSRPQGSGNRRLRV